MVKVKFTNNEWVINMMRWKQGTTISTTIPDDWSHAPPPIEFLRSPSVGRSAVEQLTSMWRCRIMGTKEKEDKATIGRRNDRADRRTSVDSKTVLVSLLYNCTRIVLFLFFTLKSVTTASIGPSRDH